MPVKKNMRGLFVVGLGLLVACSWGCARHTYVVELADGTTYYADPPLELDRKARVYHMRIGGGRYAIPLDDVVTLRDANQICYKNTSTDTFTCFDALYHY